MSRIPFFAALLAFAVLSPPEPAGQEPSRPDSLEVVQAYVLFNNAEVGSLDFRPFTHVVHGFVQPRANGQLDVPGRYLDPALNDAVHAAGGKILAGVGGHGASEALSALAADPRARARFVQALRGTLVARGYDGLELHWTSAAGSDRPGLLALVGALREELGDGLLIHVALPVTPEDRAGFSPELARHADRFPLLSYNLTGSWTGTPGHNAALDDAPLAREKSIAAGIDHWTRAGIPSSKLVLGLAFYGRAFHLEGEESQAGLFAATAGTYREIHALLGNGYVRHWDRRARVPYLVSDDGSVVWSYDDAESLAIKVEFARQRRLGGVAVWELTQDVVDGRHLLLPAVLAALR